ncbi:NAD(P)-dependent oxidoreductase [Auraticoccus monumenti]|uniref:2-hydroxy-3-oxopropionate reductase n=1 Tax=Auraticoccus monumenti TaxID=675864 RepID=A0A1G7E096_9ACTN|nr:NAD(P)-dependent oxidoreductase [Auraticoccus monumenti]SDE56765.1 2-hydroxy-3-oxopropionate reductase [Auraticoccus monumenti]
MTDAGSRQDERADGLPGAGCRVGVIGLGVMGAPMAGHVRAAGFATTVWARRPAGTEGLARAGAAVAATPAALAAVSDVVLLVLPGVPEIDAVLDGADGLLAAGPPGSEDRASGGDRVLVVCSTVSARDVEELAARPALRAAGWRVVDAPVSGGVHGAEAGTLAVFVGGAPEDVEVVLPVLRATGAPVHLGPLGAGQVAKACNQVVVAATVTALGEAAVLAERSGLDVAALFDVLGGGYAGSRLLEVKKERFAAHDHSPSGAARYMIKDLRAALDQAGRSGTTLPLTAGLLSTFTALTDAGLGDLDTAVVQAWIERGSGAG